MIKGANKPILVEGKRDISFEFASAGKSIIRAYRGGSWGNYMQFMTTPDSGTSPVPIVRMHIDKTGYIGVGTETPRAKLDVNGTIRAKEVKIEATGWPDFVFSPTYNLQPLSEVEKYIENYNHLPDIPSEKEVVENGVNVVEMQAKLLRKIEELTLYVIEQDKEIKSLKKENQEMKK